MNKVNQGISIERQVEFHETDMAGIVHFSNYFRWMEIAEVAFLRKRGISFANRESAIITGWPKVGVQCDYIAPLRFDDKVEINLEIKKIGNSSITYSFQFYKVENKDKIKVAEGEMTSVYAKFDVLKGEMSAILMGDELRQELQN